jgi:hypothetical protein
VQTRQATRLTAAVLVLMLMTVTAEASVPPVYLWNNASPTLVPDCHDLAIIGDLRCPPLMNCSIVTVYPLGRTLLVDTFGGVDGVVCSKLTVSVQRLLINAPTTIPVQGVNVSVSGTLSCIVIVENQSLGEIHIDVQMFGKTEIGRAHV